LNAAFFAGLRSPVDFLIIRHGQSEGNAARILQGRGEYPLSAKGRTQAAARGRALRARRAHIPAEQALFFSSPQGRARETALIIAEEAGLPEPVLRDDLMEMELGGWTGKTWDQVKAEDPSLWAGFMTRSWDAIPRAESSAALYRRALQVWAALRDAARSRSAAVVIAVTHGGLIQWLLKTTLQCRAWFPLFPIDNCGLFKFCVEPRPPAPPSQRSVFTCWEEINTTPPDQMPEPRGFPS
jgi:broad specificity phosphatase PhoE